MNTPLRYFAIGFGSWVEIRAAKTAPKGLKSVLKKGRKVLLSQTFYEGGTILGYVKYYDFADHVWEVPELGEIMELTREQRLKVLRGRRR